MRTGCDSEQTALAVHSTEKYSGLSIPTLVLYTHTQLLVSKQIWLFYAFDYLFAHNSLSLEFLLTCAPVVHLVSCGFVKT